VGLNINLEFDSAALAAPAAFRTAIQQAASMLDAAIANPITVNIEIEYGEDDVDAR
jgi:serralysin